MCAVKIYMKANNNNNNNLGYDDERYACHFYLEVSNAWAVVYLVSILYCAGDIFKNHKEISISFHHSARDT